MLLSTKPKIILHARNYFLPTRTTTVFVIPFFLLTNRIYISENLYKIDLKQNQAHLNFGTAFPLCEK